MKRFGKSSKIRRKGSRSNSGNGGPSQKRQEYNGPLVPKPIVRQEQLAEVLLTFNTPVSSDGLGVLTWNITSNPSTSTEWASCAALWEEYRVLKMGLVWAPNYQPFTPSTITNSQAALVYYSVRDSLASPPSSYNTAWQIGSAKMGHTARQHQQVIGMSGYSESLFTNTSTPTQTVAIGAYAQSLTVTTQYGNIFVRWLVQFRGRR